MDLKDLRCFQAVAEAGNIGRAARRLHMAQPPLSRRIHALEADIGARLFIRTPKGVEITEAGVALLDEVPNLLQLVERARDRSRDAGAGLVGRIDVGLFGSGVLDVIPRMLARFHADRPEVKIALHNMNKAEQLQALRERRITIGFNRLVPPAADLTIELVLREPMVIALPERHHLASRRELRIRDLANQQLILYPNLPVRGLAQEVLDAFRAEQVPCTVEQEVEDVVTAIALVAGGFGIAVTTQSATSLALPGVAFRPLRSTTLPDLELTCMYRRNDRSAVLAAFIGVVREFAREHAAGARPGRRDAARRRS